MCPFKMKCANIFIIRQHLDMGDKEKALKAWQRATFLKSTHSQAWINTVILLEQEGKLKEARDTAIRAIQVLKSEHTLHFILGNILGKLSEFQSAKESFERAIKICSQLKKRIPPKYFSNLGTFSFCFICNLLCLSCLSVLH